MLILTRKVGEKVIIGDDIIVTICAVNGSQVRLSFDAPKEIPIHREEIKIRIDNEKERNFNKW